MDGSVSAVVPQQLSLPPGVTVPKKDYTVLIDRTLLFARVQVFHCSPRDSERIRRMCRARTHASVRLSRQKEMGKNTARTLVNVSVGAGCARQRNYYIASIRARAREHPARETKREIDRDDIRHGCTLGIDRVSVPLARTRAKVEKFHVKIPTSSSIEKLHDC